MPLLYVRPVASAQAASGQATGTASRAGTVKEPFEPEAALGTCMDDKAAVTEVGGERVVGLRRPPTA